MATKNGMDVAVTYGQCCLVRTWLGQHVNWWAGYPEQGFKARTYAGDNLLSSNIWALGYTVDAVDGCRVHDTVHPDACAISITPKAAVRRIAPNTTA